MRSLKEINDLNQSISGLTYDHSDPLVVIGKAHKVANAIDDLGNQYVRHLFASQEERREELLKLQENLTSMVEDPPWKLPDPDVEKVTLEAKKAKNRIDNIVRKYM